MMLLAPTVAGLVALLGAFAAGEVFARNGSSSASLSMAILTAVALACYISLQAILSGARSPARERAPKYAADLAD